MALKMSEESFRASTFNIINGMSGWRQFAKSTNECAGLWNNIKEVKTCIDDDGLSLFTH